MYYNDVLSTTERVVTTTLILSFELVVVLYDPNVFDVAILSFTEPGLKDRSIITEFRELRLSFYELRSEGVPIPPRILRRQF